MVQVSEMGNSLSSISKESLGDLISEGSALLIIIFTTLFFLLESNGFSGKIQKIIGSKNQILLENFQVFGNTLIAYIIVRTKVNFAVGACFAVILYLLGIEGAFYGDF